jgi:hypothetical protein
MRFAAKFALQTVLCFVVAASPTLAAETEAPTYQLRYKFQRGESVYFTVHNEIVRRFEQASGEVETRDGNNSLKHYTVRSLDDHGQATVELMIDRTRMYAEQKDLAYTYDSATDQAPPEEFAAVHGTVGHPWLLVTLDDRGQMISATTPGGVKADEAIASHDLISRVLPLLPEKAVAVGDVWKESFEVLVTETEKLKRPIRMQRTYKLAKVDGEIATIELSTQVITAQKTPRQESFLAQGIYYGSMQLDMTRGLLIARDLHVNQSVIGYDGPGTAMSIVLNQTDKYAANGAKTELPAPRTANVDKAAAEK